jgi:cystathionine gamma-synthase
MVTLELQGSRGAVNRFMRALDSVPFAPTRGDVATIVSHPAVTSHRGLSAEAREALGIREGTVRVSVGVEDLPLLVDEFRAALDVAAASG